MQTKWTFLWYENKKLIMTKSYCVLWFLSMSLWICSKELRKISSWFKRIGGLPQTFYFIATIFSWKCKIQATPKKNHRRKLFVWTLSAPGTFPLIFIDQFSVWLESKYIKPMWIAALRVRSFQYEESINKSECEVVTKVIDIKLFLPVNCKLMWKMIEKIKLTNICWNCEKRQLMLFWLLILSFIHIFCLFRFFLRSPYRIYFINAMFFLFIFFLSCPHQTIVWQWIHLMYRIDSRCPRTAE